MTLIYKIFLLTAALIFAGCSSSIAIKDLKYESPAYNMFGGTSHRNFHIRESIGDSIKLKWAADLHGNFPYTSVTAFQDYIFVPDLSGRIFAFNIKDGKELGQIKYKGTINTAPIISHMKVIFPVTEYKKPKTTVYYYDYQHGKEVAKIEVNGNILNELQIIDEDILFVTEEGEAYRYTQNAFKVWEYDTKTFIHSSPVAAKDLFIFGNDKGEIVALNAKTGELNYRKKIGSGFESGLTVSDNTIYCADNAGIIYAIELSTGNVIWKFNTGYKITATPVTDDNSLYAGNLRGHIYKLSKKDGKLAWEISTGGVIDITPLVFNDYLVQPDLNKKLYFIDVTNGEITRTEYFESRVKLSPVYFDRKLFLGISRGKFMAYDIISDQISIKK